MAANEIKIHLSTYLKDVGIKATDTQVTRLADKVKTLNRDMQRETARTEQTLFRLPGALGKVQRAATGWFGSVMTFLGAIKLGYDIGDWLNKKVVRPLLKIKDPIKELKRENKELERQAKAAAEKWDMALERWTAGWNKAVAATERERQAIEDTTQAYLKLQQARERVHAASGEAELLTLERNKFDAMASAPTPEEAAALGKYHDVLIAELKAKQELEKFDRSAEESAAKQKAAEKELRQELTKRGQLKREMVELDRKLAYTQSQRSVEDLGFKESVKREEELLKKKAALENQIADADRAVSRRRDEIAAMAAGRSAEAEERQNLVRRTQLEIDERKKAHDDYILQITAEDDRRLAAEWEKRQAEIRQAAELELRERERLEREVAQQRLDHLRKELAERQREQSAAESRQSLAAGSLSTAWGWYRDQSRMQAVIDEQKAQAAAEVQWQKDFERLKMWRRDWRTADFGSLSASDEAVRQVAFAREEKAAADRAVIETAANTRDLADKVSELLSMKGGE